MIQKDFMKPELARVAIPYNSIWCHLKNEKMYQAEDLVINKTNNQLMIQYYALNALDNQPYVRTIEDFLNSFTLMKH